MTVRIFTAALLTVMAALIMVACGHPDDQTPAGGTTKPIGAGADPIRGGTDASTGVTSSAGVGAVRPTNSKDASVSSDDVARSATTQANGVNGKVSDQEGKPVTGALVTPTSLDTPSKAIPEVAVFTNDDGRYSWVLPTGRYRITVTADGYHAASVETEVPERGTATLDLHLRKA